MSEHVRGTATGWSVHQDYVTAGVWRWYAYGGQGNASGHAATEAEARSAALAAVEHLKEWAAACTRTEKGNA